MTAIIILNWNGYLDTIECLKSLQYAEGEFFIILIDNGSINSSEYEIEKYLADKYEYRSFIQPIKNKNINRNFNLNNKDCFFYRSDENYGFAKGNNIGIEIAKRFNPQYFLLLNNDTIVEKNFLQELINFNNINPKYKILTALIKLYSNKNLIWNCGGKIFFGFRKYYYPYQNINIIKESNFINITFVTGCCLFIEKSIVERNQIFTEKFFHGEEDFEFSLRMKKEKIKMACVLNSIIYHKVGQSTDKLNNIGKFYVHLLNRFINMKDYQNPFLNLFWKSIYMPYIFILSKRKGLNFKNSIRFIKKLNFESNKYKEVTKEMFENYLKNGI